MAETRSIDAGPELVADCGRCSGLCCVLLPFTAAAGFGTDKPGGLPCAHLRDDDRCDIHTRLRPEGWPGCAVFECFGAGQQVTQVTYAGRSWRDQDVDRGEMAAVLSALRLVHEMLFHLQEAADRVGAERSAPLRAELVAITGGAPEDVLAVDLDDLLERVGAELRAVSRQVRSAAGADPAGPDLAGRDLAGRDLRGRDLARADLRGALLIGVDLRTTRLHETDLLGADLRQADLRGADLGTALFLSQPQVNAALGDAGTTLPPRLDRPGHWRVEPADGARSPL